jgi:hypothetical protein
MKTNRIAAPYYVDGPNSSAPPDTRICWDGFNEQLSPGGNNPACDANGMRAVYMLTSLAVTPGVPQNASRKLLRSELVAPSIRPPGAVTMDAASLAPVLSGMTMFSDGGIPTTVIDGRVHNVDRTLATANRCSSVAAVATDNQQASTQIAQQLQTLRLNIVRTANSSCNPSDGTTLAPASTRCTPGLWWVRGTGAGPRFPTPTSGGTSGTSGSSGDDHDGDNGGSSGGSGSGSSSGGSGTSTTTSSTGFVTNGITTSCDPSNSSCYANLDLTAPQLMATSATNVNGVLVMGLPPNSLSPFAGAPGNSLDPAIYQTGLTNTLPNEVKTLSALVTLNQGQPNYIETTAANLAQSYGSATQPVVVVIKNTSTAVNDPGLQLTANLTGFGVLVVPNDFEIGAANFQWTGVVLVQGGAAKFVVGTGSSGFINGSLMLQPSAATATVPPTPAALTTGTSNSSFLITYSCDAIDLAFHSLPFKIISSSESSF